jgi:hypothetical protein
MPRSSFLPISRSALLVIVPVFLALLSTNDVVNAQSATAPNIVISAPELPSAYGAPPSFSQSRFSPLTNAYVLPPGAVYSSIIYENDVVHFRNPDHTFTQEIEVGLPYRINLAVENGVESYDGDVQDATFSFEARYALADWNKIPLNPTLFAEYKVGVGKILHDEGAPTPAVNFGPGGFDKTINIPDAYELRLLLSQDFFERVEWALNGFFEQEMAGDRGREWGIAQSIVTPISLFPRAQSAPPSADHKGVAGTPANEKVTENLKAGIEFQFRSFSDSGSRGNPYNSFVIGPTVAWKPTRSTRLDVSPLFGVNHKSPELQLFVVFSMFFGGGEESGGEAPASTRNR